MEQKRDRSFDARLLAELGHELRTPLTAVIGFADAMSAQAFGPLSDEYVGCAEAIGDAGRHLLGLVDDITDIANVESGLRMRPFKRFDVGELVSETLRLFELQARQAGVSLNADLPDDQVDILADRQAIRQILINLLANALKFTSVGGRITIAVDVDGVDLLLSVDDTGAGASAINPPTTAGGLGLTLVSAFCKLHKGSMVVYNAPGEGFAVTVRLPVIAEP